VTEVAGLGSTLPEEAWKDVDCGLCGGRERAVRFREGRFSIVTCTRCGVTYVTPRLADASLIASVYDEGYWRSAAAKDRGYTDYRADEALYLRTFRRRLAIVRRHAQRPGRVLDVGCAAGYFLRVMQEEGWDVTGVEPSDAIRARAEELLGRERVRGGRLEDARFPTGSFDLVTMWDVIEHLPDPAAVLAEARRVLAPGGRLVLETQNVTSLAARLLGRRWQHYKHAEHLYHFDPRTIAAALERAGFAVLENRPWRAGKYVSLAFVAERMGRVHPLLGTLLAPLRRCEGVALYVNPLDEMIVVARPR
jgi:2-polyprenyl-3-methyl-5-hydroxy-6-metoxy-1,4-benzoquinol methylase